MLTMTRRVMFSAGKVDWQDRPSNGGAPASDPNPESEMYGHNYVLDVTVTGEIDPRTGVIVNIKEIDRIVRERIVDRFDRKSIHRHVPEFCGRPVTAESLATWIAHDLRN